MFRLAMRIVIQRERGGAGLCPKYDNECLDLRIKGLIYGADDDG